MAEFRTVSILLLNMSLFLNTDRRFEGGGPPLAIILLVSPKLYSVDCFGDGGDSKSFYLALPIIMDNQWDSNRSRFLGLQPKTHSQTEFHEILTLLSDL